MSPDPEFSSEDTNLKSMIKAAEYERQTQSANYLALSREGIVKILHNHTAIPHTRLYVS